MEQRELNISEVLQMARPRKGKPSDSPERGLESSYDFVNIDHTSQDTDNAVTVLVHLSVEDGPPPRARQPHTYEDAQSTIQLNEDHQATRGSVISNPDPHEHDGHAHGTNEEISKALNDK